MEKLILHEQLEQKTRIISDTVLYPVYHYDGRVKFFRDCVFGFGVRGDDNGGIVRDGKGRGQAFIG